MQVKLFIKVIEERERLQEEFKRKSELEKDELKSTWIEKIDNTDQVSGLLLGKSSAVNNPPR
jgi:hypothetical protein